MGGALLVDVVDPILFDWPGIFPTLAANDRPMNACQIDFANWTNERFKRYEANGSGYFS